MAPNTELDDNLKKIDSPTLLREQLRSNSILKQQSIHKDDYRMQIVWRNVILMGGVHIAALYGLYLVLSGQARIITFIWGLFIGWCGALGITAGAHRLWSHRSYKATWQLRFLLMVFQTIAFENHIYEWVRDHRVHHKYTDTNADPHNSKRGFFFSHVGWLLVRKHNDVKEKGKTVHMTDLEEDPIVMFQKRYYLILMPFFCFLFPAILPYYAFGETWWNAYFVCCLFRFVFILHSTWFVNSVAHIYGYRPYDSTISPVENKSVSVIALGEGWHNYHHVFPWDYKAAELPTYGYNLTLGFLNQMAKIGWAYDMKTVSPKLVAKRAERTGDAANLSHAQKDKIPVWGWDDADMTNDDMASCQILYKRNSK